MLSAYSPLTTRSRNSNDFRAPLITSTAKTESVRPSSIVSASKERPDICSKEYRAASVTQQVPNGRDFFWPESLAGSV